jgi:hypothetical protein
MPSPVVVVFRLATSPAGRRAIRYAVRVARTPEGRKLIAEARKVATSKEGRRLIEQVKAVAKQPAEPAASAGKQTRLEAEIRRRLRRRRKP